MSIQPDLALDFAAEVAEPIVRPYHSWHGLAVENVTLETNEPYAFHWSGDTHYLAFHDLILHDTTMKVDGLPPDHTLDLRDTLTFLPHGSSVEGWSTPALRANGFTTLYFAPWLLSEELERRYEAAELRPIIYARNTALNDTMRKLGALVDTPAADALYAESACILAAIDILSLKPPAAAGTLTHRQISAVTEYMEAHLADDIGLTELAAVVQLSRYHFGRAFKTTTGLSPYAYLLTRRVERAAELLALPHLSVTEIAARSGFGSVAKLRRQFQQFKGQTPTAFRRELG